MQGKMQGKIKIGIVGIGMVGTPLMRWFLEKGWKRGETLFCYDTDPKKNFFDDISQANIVFICVPTPPNADGSCNISVVESAVAQFAGSDKIIVIKSTVPPQTADVLAGKYKCAVLSNPESLTEAQAWEDFIRPDRQIVAFTTEESRKWTNFVLRLLPTASFQSPGVMGTYKFHEVNSTVAETAKYGGNAFGATKVAFSNVLADFCELLEIQYEDVKHLVSHDRRIGDSWMDVSHGNYRGFGGFCFPKDLDALIAKYSEKFAEAKIEDEKFAKKHKLAIGFLKAIRDYNKALLESQGLTLEEVCSHDKEVEKNIKRKGRKKCQR